MFRALEPWHLIVLLVVIAVLFGSKRLPDAARGLGRSMRIFKAEVKEMREDDRRPTPGTTSPGTPAGPATPEPIQGRVVDNDPGRTGQQSEQRHDG
jgi:sec-independent protein translocase protein TatA